MLQPEIEKVESDLSNCPASATSPNTTEAGSTPLEKILDDYGQRRCNLEYLFFKFNVPAQQMALLVDLIIRRKQHEVEVRVSIYTDKGAGRVYSTKAALSQLRVVEANKEQYRWVTLLSEDGRSNIITIDAAGSYGKVGPVEWSLNFRSSGPLFEPKIPLLSRLQPFDLTLRSASEVDFSGMVKVAARTYLFDSVRGTVASYFGRALPARWFWVCANQFESAEGPVVVEAMVLYTALWGLPFLKLKAAYFYFRTAQQTYCIMSPMNGTVNVKGSREHFTITARSWLGKKYTLDCTAPNLAYNDLGERIFNTLVGDCELHGVGKATYTASLEEREAFTL